MLKVDYEKCSGCGACVQKCPKHCITWTAGEFDFRYPEVDVNTCVDCGLCEKVCPINKELKKPEDQKVYAVVHKNEQILKKSTSGGAFTALAEYVLSKNGVVYGCSMEPDFKVQHIRVEKKEELEKLRGSKYVQSDTLDTFRMVEKDLKEGHYVLYSGTPCQIDGLKHFLDQEHENLLTVDIVCHGVGSQAYFDKFLEDLETRKGKIQAIRFRDKKYVGWSCGGVIATALDDDVEDFKEEPFYNFDNYYYHYFLTGDIYRKSCYSCSYSNIERQGDFTLADFWGVEALGFQLDSFNGCSLVFVNNIKAQKIFERLIDISAVIVNCDDAVKNNAQLSYPSTLQNKRGELLWEYKNMDAEQIQRRYLKNNKVALLKGKLKMIIPYSLKIKLRSLKG